jgi:hypothetical protein
MPLVAHFANGVGRGAAIWAVLSMMPQRDDPGAEHFTVGPSRGPDLAISYRDPRRATGRTRGVAGRRNRRDGLGLNW